MPKTSNVTQIRKPSREAAKERRSVGEDALSVRFPKFCEIIGVGETKGKELIRTGKVRSVLIGRTRLISMESIRELINGQAA